jgi:hypothetical protein
VRVWVCLGVFGCGGVGVLSAGVMLFAGCFWWLLFTVFRCGVLFFGWLWVRGRGVRFECGFCSEE